jgi:hypothetical protein
MVKLFRDEKEVRLNDLVRICRKAADHYRLSGDIIQKRDQAARFARIAEKRAELCSKIERFIRDCGYLPEAPDPDRQTAANLTQRAKSLLPGDDLDALLNQASRLENQLADCFGAVLELSWPRERFEQLRGFEKELEAGKAGDGSSKDVR